MIKIVYVGESDHVFFAELSEDGKYYIVKNKNGEDIYLSKDEVIVH